ncbi:hypothetical protein V6M85_06820 [Sulfolobus tengchongensis]|uniref:Uncharacterized protein n=1 Tax=Sulfolobus tengchongensis TaxID=207809 RepID=A0AAX4KYZ5_9CREN
MNRLKQILKEALDEVEVYGSWISLYYILKSIENDIEKLCKEPEVKYDITVDSLILFTIYRYNDKIDKTRLFALSFILYDYLSKNYKVQEPLFSIRWNRRYFIYSYRIESHLNTLLKKGLLIKRRTVYYLSELGKNEAENLSIREKDMVKVNEIVNNFKALRRVKEIRIYIRKYLMGS